MNQLTRVSMIGAVGLAVAGISSVLLLSNIAHAQSTGTVSVTTTQGTTPATAGSNGLQFATIQFTPPSTGMATITSFPVTLTTGAGGAASNLSNCQIFNANGTSLTTGSNVVNALLSGSNTFTFTSPLVISGSSPVNLTVRCDIATTTVSGATFQFMAAAPSFTYTAQSPSLRVNVTAIPTVPAGLNNAVLALITVDATGSPSTVNLTSLPISLNFTGGNATNLSSCTLRDTTNLGVGLTGANVIVGGTNTLMLTTPLTVAPGTPKTLALTCNLAASAPAGGTIGLSVTPSSLGATSNGSVVTPVGGGPNGTSGITSGSITVMAAGTPTPIPSTPGVPNTGVGGGFASNLWLLTLFGVASLFGIVVLGRQLRM